MKLYYDLKTYDELVTFQRMVANQYPYYPIKMQDWKKMHYETITKQGLEQLFILKRQITLGKARPEDVVIYLRLLELYVCSNPSHERLKHHKKEIDFHFETLFKSMYNPDLIKEGLTIPNKDYDENLMIRHLQWFDRLIQECYRLSKVEGNNVPN